MRMSCNGCRVLRKGCSENCSIRPCLLWIKSPEAQANATVFLAKFYGRAGLMNLINSGPDHLRPAIFRSLLYEACGRIVNPIYGSVGLLWAGSWHHCQSAVEAVLKGNPIVQIPSESAVGPSPASGPGPTPPLPPSAPKQLKAYDIRHVAKADATSSSQSLHKVRTRNRFKRSSAAAAAAPAKPEPDPNQHSDSATREPAEPTCPPRCYPEELDLDHAPSHDSSAATQHSNAEADREADSVFSVETVETSLVDRVESDQPMQQQDAAAVGVGDDDDEMKLDLTLGLGFGPLSIHEKCGPVAAREEKA